MDLSSTVPHVSAPCHQVPHDAIFAQPLMGIFWSCDAKQQAPFSDHQQTFCWLYKVPFSRRLWVAICEYCNSQPTTVRDVSISTNTFSLKAELFCRAYRTDLAPMWQLTVNSLHEHKFSYLLTYLLTPGSPGRMAIKWGTYVWVCINYVLDEWESCSSEEEDDDSDSSWIDVHHSSDDEQCDVSMLCILMI